MTTLKEVEAIEAEFNYYRDKVALLRARLYRNGVVTNARLEELEQGLARVQRRLRAARADSPLAKKP